MTFKLRVNKWLILKLIVWNRTVWSFDCVQTNDWYKCNILTSDPAELSSEKCTCVNNSCIRSKISRDNLDCWIERKCDAHKKQVDGEQLYNLVRQEVEISWRSEFEVSVPVRGARTRSKQRLGPQAPGWAAQENGKKCRYSQKSWGSICCSLCSVSNSPFTQGCPRGVMVKAMNCGIVVREFVLQSRYYVHFRANTLGTRYESDYSPSSYG